MIIGGSRAVTIRLQASSRLAVGRQAGGFAVSALRRLLRFSLFWHALDIIWVGVFTLVYLMGAR